MNHALIEGVSVGLLLSAIVGPVFFTLIQSSLEHGFRYAAVVALGILLSDSVYVILTYFGIQFLSENTYFEPVLGYLGGAILIGFGISSLLKKQNAGTPDHSKVTVQKARKRNAFLKGFGINGINPFVLLFWVSIASLVHLKQDFGAWDTLMYYMGTLLTVFTIDLIKAFIARKLARWVTPGLMGILNKAVGIAIIGFGVRMIWFTIN